MTNFADTFKDADGALILINISQGGMVLLPEFHKAVCCLSYFFYLYIRLPISSFYHMYADDLEIYTHSTLEIFLQLLSLSVNTDLEPISWSNQVREVSNKIF